MNEFDALAPAAASEALDSVLGALVDPGADRLLFWDDSAGTYAYLIPGTGLTISGTTLDVDLSATYQPIDSDLTAIAALSTTSFGRGLLTEASASTARSTLGIGLVGKMLSVDSVNGSDSTGTRGRADLPYLTLAAAKTAASSGDTITVRPGTYNERNLLKNGVNWHFMAGASVVSSSSSLAGIWDDSSNGANGAVTCFIDGLGVFDYTRTTGASDASESAIFNVTNAGSVIRVHCLSAICRATGVLVASYTLWQTAGALYVQADRIESIASGSIPAGSIRWSKGTCHVISNEIIGAGASALAAVGSSSPNGDLYVRCNRMTEAYIGASMIDLDSALNAETKVWITALEIAQSGTGAVAMINCRGGKLYLHAQKISTTTGATSLLSWTGGSCWLNADKLTTNGLRWIATTGTTSSDYLAVRCPQWEDGGGAVTIGIDMTGGSGRGLIQGGRMKTGASGVGVYHSALTLSMIIADMQIDTSTNASGTGYAVQLAGIASGKSKLHNCALLVDPATDSIYAASARSIAMTAPCISNRNKNANVTLAPNAGFTVDSALT